MDEQTTPTHPRERVGGITTAEAIANIKAFQAGRVGTSMRRGFAAIDAIYAERPKPPVLDPVRQLMDGLATFFRRAPRA